MCVWVFVFIFKRDSVCVCVCTMCNCVIEGRFHRSRRRRRKKAEREIERGAKSKRTPLTLCVCHSRVVLNVCVFGIGWKRTQVVHLRFGSVCVCVSKGFFPLGTHSLFLTLQKLNTATDRAAAKNPQLSAPRNTHTSICWSLLYAHSLIFFLNVLSLFLLDSLSLSLSLCFCFFFSVLPLYSRSKKYECVGFPLYGWGDSKKPQTHTHTFTHNLYGRNLHIETEDSWKASLIESAGHTHIEERTEEEDVVEEEEGDYYILLFMVARVTVSYIVRGFPPSSNTPTPPRGWSSAYAILPQRAVRFFASSYVHIYFVLLCFYKAHLYTFHT